MTQLFAQLQIGTHVVWGASSEEIDAAITRAEVNGWRWDGKVHWHHQADNRICCAVLVDLASHKPPGDTPRLTLTRA